MRQGVDPDRRPPSEASHLNGRGRKQDLRSVRRIIADTAQSRHSLLRFIADKCRTVFVGTCSL
jgi:hypothetical protein